LVSTCLSSFLHPSIGLHSLLKTLLQIVKVKQKRSQFTFNTTEIYFAIGQPYFLNNILLHLAGCNSTCQKECIEVINKYRLNHQAKEVQFSQVLADKAQKWADGGKFGYDMKSRGKYGQLIEWDVKDELQNFTTVIKHWHDKEKDFDFASGRSRTGKTLHDFTQIVWKKARKAGCGQSEIFGSEYYVVWMDSDGIVSPDVQVGAANIGTPEKVFFFIFL